VPDTPEFDFKRLQTSDGLDALTREFEGFLDRDTPGALARLAEYQESAEIAKCVADSELILEIAPVLERFLAGLFGVETPLAELRD
jgi:hypothetical protein